MSEDAQDYADIIGALVVTLAWVLWLAKGRP